MLFDFFRKRREQKVQQLYSQVERIKYELQVSLAERDQLSFEEEKWKTSEGNILFNPTVTPWTAQIEVVDEEIFQLQEKLDKKMRKINRLTGVPHKAFN